MTPLALFLLGCAAIFLGTVQAAFSALMRLSLRLMAERGGRSDALGHYLDDPLQLFIPARVLLGGCYVFAGALIARLIEVRNAPSLALFIVSLVAFVVVCEHLVPMAITRRDPEQVLDVVLPVFRPVERLVYPLTLALLNLGHQRRDKEGNGQSGTVVDAEPASAVPDADEESVI